VDNRFLAERENMATISTPSQMSPNARGLFEILKEANIKQMQYCLQLHHELAVTEGEFAARDYEEQFPALPDGIEASAPKRKPPAREKAPDDPLRDACTSAKFAAEVGMGDDYVRDWFTAHPDGAYVDGHDETLTVGKYFSLRITPEGRRLYIAAHTRKLLHSR